MAVTKYSNAERLAICAAWSLAGDDQAVCVQYGVEISTLARWKKEKWWIDSLDTFSTEYSQRLIAKANRAMASALDELEDRIHRGDVKVYLESVKTTDTDGNVVIDKQAQQYREPVKARDLSQIINVLAQRSEKAVQLASQHETNYQLSDLQTSFRQFASTYRAKQITDSKTIEHSDIETANGTGQ